MSDFQEYLKLEDGDGDPSRDRPLRFVRTAKAFGSSWWIWEYNLEDGTHCYATIQENSQGQVCLAMDWSTEGMTPTEYLVDLRRRTIPTN